LLNTEIDEVGEVTAPLRVIYSVSLVNKKTIELELKWPGKAGRGVPTLIFDLGELLTSSIASPAGPDGVVLFYNSLILPR